MDKTWKVRRRLPLEYPKRPVNSVAVLERDQVYGIMHPNEYLMWDINPQVEFKRAYALMNYLQRAKTA